jgi:2'-5' RNA ligase
MMRLFIGLGLPKEARDALRSAVSGVGIRGQTTPKENYHLTLAFLGERDERQAPALQKIVAAAAKERSPLALEIRGFGFFGRRENALLYAKLAPSPPLFALAGALRRLLAEAGEPFDDKPFAAHITLARWADLTGLPPDAPAPETGFSVDRLTLYHSARIRGDLRYRPVFEAPLREDRRQA